MSFDFSKMFAQFSDELLGKIGEPLGLTAEQSTKAGKALMAHFAKGENAAVKAAADEAGIGEEVAGAMLAKLVETGKERFGEQAGAAVENALNNAIKDTPLAALATGDAAKVGAGLLGKLFGKK